MSRPAASCATRTWASGPSFPSPSGPSLPFNIDRPCTPPFNGTRSALSKSSFAAAAGRPRGCWPALHKFSGLARLEGWPAPGEIKCDGCREPSPRFARARDRLWSPTLCPVGPIRVHAVRVHVYRARPAHRVLQHIRHVRAAHALRRTCSTHSWRSTSTLPARFRPGCAGRQLHGRAVGNVAHPAVGNVTRSRRRACQ